MAKGVNKTQPAKFASRLILAREGEKGGSLRDFQPIEVHPGTSCKKIVSFVHSSRLPVGILLWELAEPYAQSNEAASHTCGAALFVAHAQFPTNWTVPCTIGKHTVGFVIAGVLRVGNLLWGARSRSGGAAMVARLVSAPPSAGRLKFPPNPIGLSDRSDDVSHSRQSRVFLQSI